MRAEALQRILRSLPDPSRPASGLSPSAGRAQAALSIRTGADWEQARILRGWSYRACAGRLIELSGTRAAPLLTLAFALVLDAQRAGEPVAWVQLAGSTFFPPDAARNGVDLKSLVVVRLPDGTGEPERKQPALGQNRPVQGDPARTLARAAVRLLRSGAFGLIALDLTGLEDVQFRHAQAGRPGAALLAGSGAGHAAGRAGRFPGREARLSPALLGKLGQLAQQHDTAMCCLTVKGAERPSLGSLVSLRGEAVRRRVGEDRFSCMVRALKDKRGGPGWTHEEVAGGTPGLS